MPLVQTTNTKYITIDTTEVAFKSKTSDGELLSTTYEGWLEEVRWVQDEYNGRPANKFHFVFRDGTGTDATTEIIQSGDNSVFSGSLINTLLGVEGEYGEFTIGVYQPDGKEYIANWVKHNGQKAGWKYSAEQVNNMAERSFDGNKTKLWKALFSDELLPQLEDQGTTVGSTVTEDDMVVPNENVSELDDLDDDLPF